MLSSSLLLYNSYLSALLSLCSSREPFYHDLKAFEAYYLSLDIVQLVAKSEEIYLRLIELKEIFIRLHRPDPLQNLSPPDIQRETTRLFALVETIVTDKDLCARARALRGPDAVAFMDLLQRILDAAPDQHDRAATIKLLQDVCDETGELPSSLWLSGAELIVDRTSFFRRGGEADIWLGTLHGVKIVARDVLKSHTEAELKLIRREILAHRQLSHPNVLELMGVARHEYHPLSIITPFMEGGDARAHLEAHPKNLLHVIEGTARAIRHLHDSVPCFVHGDIHGRNILISSTGEPILADFGFTRIRHEITRSQTKSVEGGSLRHLAPELVSGVDFKSTTATDIFAFAMTILELGSGASPFIEHPSKWTVAIAIGRGERPRQPPRFGVGTGMRSDRIGMLWKLIEDMWVQEPSKRLDIHQVCDALEALSMPSTMFAVPSRRSTAVSEESTTTAQTLGDDETTWGRQSMVSSNTSIASQSGDEHPLLYEHEIAILVDLCTEIENEMEDWMITRMHDLLALQETWSALSPLESLVQSSAIHLCILDFERSIQSWRVLILHCMELPKSILPVRDVKTLSYLVRTVAHDPVLRANATQLKTREAQILVDHLQTFLDEMMDDITDGCASPADRIAVLSMLQIMSDSVDVLPSMMWLDGCVTERIVMHDESGVPTMVPRKEYEWLMERKTEGQVSVSRTKVLVRNPLDEKKWSLGRAPGVRKIWNKVVRREILAQQMRHHPNITRIFGVVRDLSGDNLQKQNSLDISIVTTAVLGLSSKMYLKQHPEKFLHIISGISDAINYLHHSSPFVIHGDVRTRNVCIDLGGNAILCDTDFVRARNQVSLASYDPHQSMTYLGDNHAGGLAAYSGGPVRYSAPELLSPVMDTPLATMPTDIYGLAMTFLELWTLEPPFAEHINGYAVMHAVIKGERPKRPAKPHIPQPSEPHDQRESSHHSGNHELETKRIYDPGEDDDLWRLICGMWAPEPSERPNAKDIVAALELIRRNEELSNQRMSSMTSVSIDNRIKGSKRTFGLKSVYEWTTEKRRNIGRSLPWGIFC